MHSNSEEMIQLQIEIEEAIIRTFGRAQVEKQLKEYVSKLYLKVAAQEILKDLEETDLTNDPEWQAARDLAWKQEKHNYIIPLA